MNVLPGEPVPPGFEDEVTRVANIQKEIQGYKGNALIGLEYAIELHDGREREPYYMCALCDKRCDPRTIMQHWTSFGHRHQYLDKHFPSAMRELEPVRNKPDKMKVMVQSLSEAVERHHGRLQLSVCSSEDFRRLKNKIYEDVKAKFHYDERNGPNFVNVIDRSLLQLTVHQKADKSDSKSAPEELDEISSDSDAGNNVSKKSRQQASGSRFASAKKSSPAAKSEDGLKEQPKIKFPTPKELSLQASHIAQERYKWEKYRCLLEIYLKQAEKLFKDYDKNPEKHPLYPEEWKSFWNRRYKELQKEKKVDPNRYDYRPEWALYWSKRRKEIFDMEVEKKKKEIKAKLELPEDAEEILDRLKEKYKVQANRPNGAEAEVIALTNNKRDNSVIDISDEEPERSPPTHSRNSHATQSRSSHFSRSISPRSRSDSKRPRRRSQSRSISPFSDDYEYDSRQIIRGKVPRGHGAPPPPLASFSTRRYPPAVEREYRHPYFKHASALYSAHYHGAKEMFSMHPQYERTMSSSPPPSQVKKRKEPEPEPEEEGPLTVVAVLRLLTALEDILGSLGPKMVDLLGKALALDNVKANSADELLLNDDNIVFFETAKEKLKGLLIAEVIDDSQKVRAVKKAIKNIAAIVHQVSTKGKYADKKEDSTASGSGSDLTGKAKANKAVSIKDLPFDRQLVASKLAAELVKHGREDLSTADVDKLIYLFILMVKLSKDKYEIDEKPLHLKDIATELGIKLVSQAKTPEAASTASLLPSRSSQNNLKNFVDDIFDEEAAETEISNDRSEKSTKNDAGSSLESLTDSDLQTLLQNFKYLSTEEQHHLIAHLKKLETTDPTRVEKLRKFVNLNDLTEATEETTYSNPASSQRSRNDAASVTSNKGSNNKNREDSSPRRSMSRDRGHDSDDDNSNSNQRGINVVNPNKFSLDDEDDDDYNFEDVLKAASSIVDSTVRQSKTSSSGFNKSSEASTSKSNTEIDPPAPGTSKSSTDSLTFNRAAMNSSSNISLSDTQSLIDNLMGNLQQNNASKKPTAQETKQAPQPVPTVLSSQNMPQSAGMQFYQSYDQQRYPQQYPQQYPPQQQQPQPPPPSMPQQGYGGNNQMPHNQMGYTGNDQNAYYGYNNAYPGYNQQQWGAGYNMYGGN